VAPVTQKRGNVQNLRPWPKGVSGNPGGRPKKVHTVAELAEDHSDKAMQTLIKLMGSDKDQVALAAAQAVLDRAIGKPKQTVESTVDMTITKHEDALEQLE